MENGDRSDGLRQEMSEASPNANRRSSLGYVLLVSAFGVLYSSRGIAELGLGNNADPGARLFPIGLSILLAFAGVIEIWRDLRARSESKGISIGKETDPVERKLSTDRRIRVLGLLVVFALFILAIPWLGFTLSTLLFATAMMMMLGASWKLAGSVTIVLVLIVNLLFGALFHVPLPTGITGLPF